MTFYTSLTGLQASQTEMSTISHNLANVATNGFKKSRTEFADIIASNVNTSPTMMVGSGTVVKANRQQFTEGNLVQSGSALDLAISGDGFFAVKSSADAGKIDFTRNGSFSPDTNGYIVDGQGSRLQGYPVDGSGTVVATGLDSTKDLRIPETSGTPVATTKVAMTLNLNAATAVPTKAFDRFDPSTYGQSTQTTVYDASGNAQTMTSYYRHDTPGTDTANSGWSVYSYIGDTQLKSGGSDHIAMSFDSSGKIASPTTPTKFDAVTLGTSTSAQQISLDLGTATTQLAAPFNVATRSQDGKAVGQFENVVVDTNGMVKASFSNGDTQVLGQVALANFNNPQGLRQLGDSYWEATGISGSPTAGAANANGLGKLMSGTIERSNVDMTEELVDLIAAQRNFQANSKALDTQSQTLETIFNIRS